MKKFSHILAVDEKNWLGKDNDLAWRIPSDMKYFKEVTSTTKDPNKYNAVIMGRKTWESIPQKYRPLPGRVNCILSRSITKESVDSQEDDFVLYFNSIENCIKELSSKENLESIFVIWGANIYNQLLTHPDLEKIYLTQVYWDHGCDVFFDGVPHDFHEESSSERYNEKWMEFEWKVYKKNK